MAGFQLALGAIGPVSRNPERDTERTRVVRARSPSLCVKDAFAPSLADDYGESL
jgi:hypothetical protein